MAQPAPESSDDPPPALRTLLLAGTALLQPPAPLPASPPELLSRLKASSARLPLSWRASRPEWSDETELPQVGDDDSSNAVRRKIRRDDLVMVVAKRSLSLLVGMQGWLEKECWPESLRPRLKPSDCVFQFNGADADMLGGVDNKIVLLLVSHTISSLLLQLSITYEAHLKTNNGQQTAIELSAALTDVLFLLAPPRLPPQQCGPSSIPRLPLTPITTLLHNKHLPNILLSCILLAYTPTTEPAVHQKLRSQFIQTLNQLSPTNTLVALGGALQILLSGQKEKSPVRGWIRPWPAYVLQTVKSTMSAQITKPGGSRALIAYMFSDPSTAGADERRLEIISKTLTALPKGLTEDKYVPRVLEDLLAMIAFVDVKPPPKIYVHAAAYTFFKLWEKYRDITQTWIHRYLAFPGQAKDVAEHSTTVFLQMSIAQKIIIALKALIMYAPPTSAYLACLLAPNLHPLFALFTYRYMAITSSEVREVASRGKTKAGDRSPHDAAGILVMLDTWLRVATKEEAVDALWRLIVVDSVWKRSFERENALGWEGPVGQEHVVVKSAHAPPQISATAKREDSSDMSSALRGMSLDPDPEAFVALLKSIERTEVASEIFLKLLNQWRTTHKTKNGPRLLAVQFLRLVSRILEAFGSKLLTTTEHLLLFVEGTLFDALEDIAAQTKVRMINAPKTEDLTDAEEIDQLSPVDISLRLLLAIVAGLDENDDLQRLLLPIKAHVHRLAGQTQLTEIKTLANQVMEAIDSTRYKPPASATATAEEAYQEALAVVRDPILPVRAHGLAMLSEIVKSDKYDRKLDREILSQFKLALWNEDSFVYLQASKHLASMVYVLGPEIFRAVWALYAESVDDVRTAADETPLSRALRLGETVDTIILALGKAFSIHDATLPTIVRASAVAILESCANADYLSLGPLARELLSGMVDLLQVESVADSPFRPVVIPPEIKPAKSKIVLIEDEDEDEEALLEPPEPAGDLSPPRTIDEEPTKANDGHHPALRRSAASFLGVLVHALLQAIIDQSPDEILLSPDLELLPNSLPTPSDLNSNALLGLDAALIQSTITPLMYIASTDIDESTREQAMGAGATAKALYRMMSLMGL